MSFVINFKENIRITYPSLDNITVADLKKRVADHYSITNFELLDLGRIISESELLNSLERKTFTIYFYKTIQ